MSRTGLCGVTAGMLAAGLSASPTQALPSYAGAYQVNSGGGAPTVSTSGSTTTVTAPATRTVLNWSTYVVNSGEAVNYQLSSRNAITLNVVQGGKLDIEGAVRSTVGGVAGGNIWFSAPAGVIIGNGGVVDVGGFLATTATLRTSGANSFLDASNNTFALTFGTISGNGSAPTIDIQGAGQITAHGGLVALIAPAVQTASGVRITSTGDVLVAAASNSGGSGAGDVLLQLTPNATNDFDLVSFTVPSQSNGSCTDFSYNSCGAQEITPINLAGQTTGGSVSIAAVGAQTLASAVVKAPGLIKATSASSQGGDIILSGGGGIASRQIGPAVSNGAGVRFEVHDVEAARDLTVASNYTLTNQYAFNANLGSSDKLVAGRNLTVNAPLLSIANITVGPGSNSPAPSSIVLNAINPGMTPNANNIVSNVAMTGGSANFAFTGTGGIIMQGGFSGATAATINTGGNFQDVPGFNNDFGAANGNLSIAAGGSISINTVRNVNVGSLVSGNANLGGDPSITVSGTSAVSVGNAFSPNNVTISSSQGSVTAGTLTAANGSINVTASGGDATINSAKAGDDVLISASQAATVSYAQSQAPTGYDPNSGQPIYAQDAYFGNTQYSYSPSGRKGYVIDIQGGTNATLNSGSAGTDIFVRAQNGDAYVGGGSGGVGVTAGDDLFVMAVNGDAQIHNAHLTGAGNDYDGTLQASSGYCNSCSGGGTPVNNGFTDADNNGQRVELSTTGSLGGDAYLGGGNGQSSGTVTGASYISVSAVRDAFVDLLGSVTIDSLTAGGNIVASADDLSITTASAGGDASVTANSGDASIGSINASGSLSVSAPGTTSVSTATVGADLNLTGGDVYLTVLTGESVGGSIHVLATNGGFNYSGYSLTAGQDLTIEVSNDLYVTSDNTFTAQTGNLRLTSQNGGVFLSGDLNAGPASGSQTVTLQGFGGPVDQQAGIITAGTVTGASVGYANLTAANQVGALGSFTNSADNGGSGNNFFSLVVSPQVTSGPSSGNGTGISFISAYSGGLTVTGAVDSGPGDLSITTTGGPLTLAADLTAGGPGSGQFVTLTSAGDITQTSGTISADTLTGSSNGAVSLTGLNQVSTLGVFTDASGFSFTDAYSSGLTVVNDIDGGTGDIVLNATAGPLALQANLTAGGPGSGQTVSLYSADTLTQTSGVITAGTLIGHSVNGATLTANNQFDTLGGLINTQSGAITINDAYSGALTVNGNVNSGGGDISLTAAGPLTLAAFIDAGVASGSQTVTLIAGGDLTQTGGAITAGNLTGSAQGVVSLTGYNQVANLGAFTDTSGFAFTDDYYNGLTVNTAIDGGTGNVTLTTTSGALTIAANITAGAPTGSQTVSLNSADTITQTGGIITAGVLTGSSINGTTLTAANRFGVLSAFANGQVQFTGKGVSVNGSGAINIRNAFAAGMVVNGPISNLAGDVTLTTTAGPMTLAGNVSAQMADGSGATVALNAGGAISQTAGAITAGTLTGASIGGATLSQTNAVATLGAFTNSGGGGFSLNDGTALTVGGPVDAGAGNLSLSATGGLTLAGNLTAGAAGGGQSVTLSSSGAISQTGGLITAGLLTGSSGGAVTLTAANQVRQLGAFTDASGFSFTDAYSAGLTVTNAVSGGTGNVVLNATGGPLTLAANITAGAANGSQSVTLTSSGAITQTGGGVTAGTLTGASSGAVSLTGTNQVANLGAFADASGFAFTDAYSGGLTVTNAISGGTGNVALSTTGGPLTLAANITAGAANGSQSVMLNSAATITQSSGIITAGNVNGHSAGATVLNGLNQVATFGPFSDPAAPPGGGGGGGGYGVSFTSAYSGGLTVTGAVDGGPGNVVLTTTAGPLTLAANVTAGAANGSQSVTLTSFGAITQTGGIITAGLITGSSGGTVSLTGANQIAQLGAFTDASGFAFTDAFSGGLTVTNAVSGGTGNVALSATGGPLTLAANVTAGFPSATQSVTLASSGAISQTSGVITTGTLTGSSGGAVTLTGANQVGNLGAFTDASGFSFTDAYSGGLTVTNAVNGGTGNVALNASGGALTLQANITAGAATGSQSVTLTALGAINQTAGVITAGTITGSAGAAVSLTDNNQVTQVAAFTSGSGFTFNDAVSPALTISGGVSGGTGNVSVFNVGSLTLLADISAGAANGSQTVTLSTPGTLTQGSGVITAGQLSGGAFGATLTGANQVGQLGSFSTFGPSGLRFVDSYSGGLVVVGPISGGTGGLVLTTTAGPLALAANVTAGAANGSQSVTLNSFGAISQTGGIITAGTLTGSSGAAVALTAQNQVATLGAFTDASGFSFTDAYAGGLTITNPLSGGTGNVTLNASGGPLALTANLTAGGANGSQTVNLTSAGAITQTGGIITAGTLTGSSGATVSLTAANQVATLGAFTDASGFAFTDAYSGGLTVNNPLSGGTGNVALSATGGPLTLAANVSAGAAGGSQSVTLASSGNISQTTGLITAGTLTGSSGGAVTLTGANQVGTLGNFSDASGFSFTDAYAGGLTVNNAVSGGTGNLALNASGGALTLAANVTAGAANGSQTVTLTALGGISQTGGIVTAGTITGSSGAGVLLTGANQVRQLGAFTDATGFAFTDAYSGGLTVTNAVNGGTGNVALNASGGPLTLQANITAGAANGPQSVTLASSGAITQSSGVITAGQVTGSSGGAVALTSANQIGQLGAFTDASGFSFTDAYSGGLYVNNAVNGGAGNVNLNASGGVLILNSDITTTTGGFAQMSLQAAGSIIQTGGVITTSYLVGSSGGSVSLPDANQVARIANFNSASGLTFNSVASQLSVEGTINGGTGNVTFSSRGPMQVNGSIVAGGANGSQTVSLSALGQITENAISGLVTAATLTGSSFGGATLTQANQIANLGAFTNGGIGDVSITSGYSGGLAVIGPISMNGFTTGNLYLATTAGPLTLSGNITNGAANGTHTVSLVSSGAINQTAGVITAGTLTGSSGGAASLSSANQVATLAGFASGSGFLLTDAYGGGLTVTNTVNGGTGNVTVNASGGPLTFAAASSGPLVITPNITAGAANGSQTVTLLSAGAITQIGGIVTAGTLTGSSGGAVSLTNANQVGQLAAFSDVSGFAFTDAYASGLTISGAISAGAGNIALATTTGPLALAANLNSSATISLTSAKTLSQSAGVITAASLTGSSVGGATLNQANQVAALGSFANSGAGGVSFTDAQALTVNGPVNAGAGALNLTTTSGPLVLAGNLTAGAANGSQAVTLTAAGSVSQSAGVITAGVLGGSSGGAVALTGQNQVRQLGGFTDASGFAFTDAYSGGLTITNAVDGGTGNVALTTTGGPLALAANVTAGAAGGSQSVTLTSATTLTQSAGAITAGTLSGSSVGGATLTQANQVNRLGAFANSGAGGVSFTDAYSGGLAVTGPVSGGAGNVTLSATAGPLVLAGNVTAGAANGGQTVSLSSSGAITQSGGIITAGVLTGASGGQVSLTGANQVGQLAAFTDGSGFAFTDAYSGGLTVTNAVSGGTGNVALNATGGPLVLAANVTAGAANGTQIVTLTSSGGVSQTGGVITAGTLTGSSGAAVTLTGANQVGQLGAFADATGFAFTDAYSGGLTVANAVNGGTGNVALSTSAGPLTLAANVTAGAANGSQTVTLSSAGALTQTGGVVTAGTVTGSSGAAVSLTGQNQVAALGGFTDVSGFAFTDAYAGGLTVGNAVNGGTGNVALSATGGPLTLAANITAGAANGSQSVTLASSGAISQSGGVVTAGLLTGSSGGAVALTGANQVGQLGAFTDASGFSFTDAYSGGLTVTNAVNGGTGNVALSANGGPLTLSANVTAGAASGSQTVTLSSSGAINQNGGVLTAGVLAGSSGGAVSLTGANQVRQLGVFSDAGGFAFTDAYTGGLTVGNAVNGGAGNVALNATGGPLTLAANLTAGAANGSQSVTLTSSGSITQPGGIITAGLLTGASGGAVALTGGNQVGQLGAFTDASGFAFTDAYSGGLTLANAVNGGTGNVALSATGGALTLAANVTAGAANGTQSVTLNSAGALTQTGGIITAGLVTGSAATSVSLTGANQVGQLGAFTDATGFSFTDGYSGGLTVTNAVSGGTGNVALNATSGPLVLAANVAAGAANGTQTVALTSAGGLSQTSGVITAGLLTGSSGGAVALTGANQVGQLGAFTDASGISFTDAYAGGLTVNNTINGGTGNVALTASGGPLTLAANLIAGAANGTQSVALTSAGMLNQTSGVIIAGVVTGGASGGASLTQANQVGALGAFTNAGAGGVSFASAYSAGLAVSGPVDGGAGNVTLTSVTGPLVLTGNVTAGVPSGVQTVTLASSGDVSQAGGIITAGLLTGSSGGAVSLTGANQVRQLGGFANASGFSFADAASGGLTINNAISGGTGNVALTASGGPLTLAANITAGAANGGQSVTLASSGAITQSSGIITAGTLTGSSGAAVSLTGQNQVARLGAFTDASGFSFTDAYAGGLTVNNAVSGGTGNVSLNASGGPLTLAANITAGAANGSQSVTLTSSGAISQTGGAITAGLLTGSANGPVSLTGANQVGQLGAFSNAGGFAFTNAGAGGLMVTSAIDGGSGNVALNSTNGPLVLAANITAGPANGSQTVTLTSSGTISQSSGIITAGVLTGSSGGSVSLTGANQVGALGAFTDASGFSFTDAYAGGLSVNNAVSGGTGNVSLNASGGPLTLAANITAGVANGGQSVTLASSGAIMQSSGIITAGTLTGSSGGAVSLTGANQIGTLGSFTDASGFAFTDAYSGGLAVTNAINGGAGAVALNASGGPLTLGANITAGAANGTQSVTLASAGVINQTSGVITAGVLSGSSVGGATLTAANQVGALRSFSNSGAGGFSLTNAYAGGLAISGAINGGTGDVNLSETAGGINATAVVSSGGAVNATAAGTLVMASVTGTSGAVSLRGTSVTVTSLTSGGSATVTSTNGDASVGTGRIGGAGVFSVQGKLSLGDVSADTAQVIASDLDIAANLSARQVQVQSRGGPLTLGGTAAPTSGLWLDNAEFGRITASNRLDLYAGLVGGAARGDLIVQDLAVTPSRTPALNLYAGTSSNVLVRGALAPTVSGAVLTIGDATAGSAWTPQSIQVTGSLGAATRSGASGFTGVRAFDSVALTAGGDVLLGSQRFIDLVSPAAAGGVNVAANTPSGVQPTGSEIDRIYLTAGVLKVSTGGKLVAQNTAAGSGDFAGLYLTNPNRSSAVLTIDPPSVVDLFGAFVDRNGTLQTGQAAAVSPDIVRINQLATATYRFNGCIIGQGCSSVTTGTGTGTGSGTGTGNGTGTGTGSGAGSGDTSGSTSGGGGTPFTPQQAFQVQQFFSLVRPDELTDSPLLTTSPEAEDERDANPVVTGTGNEEIWRRQP